MDSYDTTPVEGTDLPRRMLELEARLLDLESAVKTQRRMLAPVCLVTAGLVLAFASFGLIPGQSFNADLLDSWTMLFLVLVLVMMPLTVYTVMLRTAGLRGATAASWVVIGVFAVCMGAGPRGNLAEALGVGPWYLLGAVLITVIGLLRLPVADPVTR
ncbi:MAG: hypothetical protein ACRDUA_04730 [Micromonosporaceae bacterium]